MIRYTGSYATPRTTPKTKECTVSQLQNGLIPAPNDPCTNLPESSSVQLSVEHCMSGQCLTERIPRCKASHLRLLYTWTASNPALILAMVRDAWWDRRNTHTHASNQPPKITAQL